MAASSERDLVAPEGVDEGVSAPEPSNDGPDLSVLGPGDRPRRPVDAEQEAAPDPVVPVGQGGPVPGPGQQNEVGEG